MGSAQRLDNGRWRAQVWVVDPASGERRRVTKIHDRKRDAEDWARETESSPAVAEGTTSEMLDRYLARQDIEPSSRTTHRAMMQYPEPLRPLRLSELKLALVEQLELTDVAVPQRALLTS